MSKVLRLYNTYSRCINEARLASGEVIALPEINRASPTHGSLYICGPTVYSDSHLGHALTYVRADLLRRVLKTIFNVRLTTVMNITDIDDKILDKSKADLPSGSLPETRPDKHPFNRISEKYCKSFVDDMHYIRVTPPDLTIKVSKQICIITNYIKRLEKNGHAYLASNGDIYFKVSSVPNYKGRVDDRKTTESAQTDIKGDIRDFVLWKAAKPGEPIWVYESATGVQVQGRPGWHVQCSAISSAIFGNQLDFHFGGKDLIFPHNYNELACCCAYHNLDTSKDINVWSANWLHAGHLILREEKMSKSLGNVVGIKRFIDDSSVNALRLLCVDSHYRSDIDFNDGLLGKMESLDHKIKAFTSYLSDGFRRMREDQIEGGLTGECFRDMRADIERVQENIIDGICDDLDLNKGLCSILDLAKLVYNTGLANIRPRDLVIISQLLSDWCSMCGLQYGPTSGSHDESLLNLVQDFRQEIRDTVIRELKRRKQQGIEFEGDFPVSLLERCDRIRGQLDELGFIVRDVKT